MGHIWLIGMMGSGKTTVGRALAVRRGKPFYDTDELVEREAGKPIREIFAEDGERRFRALEAVAVEKVAGLPDGVVAAGGGAILDDANIERMRSVGTTVLLHGDPGTFADRIAPGKDRPLIVDDAHAELRAIAAIRAPRYEAAADAVVDARGSVEEVADLVERACAAS